MVVLVKSKNTDSAHSEGFAERPPPLS
jgi:hypothetical protein